MYLLINVTFCFDLKNMSRGHFGVYYSRLSRVSLVIGGCEKRFQSVAKQTPLSKNRTSYVARSFSSIHILPL